MSKEQNDAVTDMTSTSPGAVALTIDYGNGAHKSFAVIPWKEGIDVLDVLRTARSIEPGLVFEFSVTLPSDRAGRQRGFIASIDGVKADQTNQKWLVWINDRLVGNELATAGEFGAGTSVNRADVLALKLTTGQ